MKLIKSGNSELRGKFNGKKFTCSKTGNLYEVEQGDELVLTEKMVGQGRDDTTAHGFACPDCGGFVYLNGNSLSHRY